MVIEIKDVCKIFNRSYTYSSRKLKDVKDSLNLKRDRPVTIDEFCQYYELNKEDVIKTIEKNQ